MGTWRGVKPHPPTPQHLRKLAFTRQEPAGFLLTEQWGSWNGHMTRREAAFIHTPTSPSARTHETRPCIFFYFLTTAEAMLCKSQDLAWITAGLVSRLISHPIYWSNLQAATYLRITVARFACHQSLLKSWNWSEFIQAKICLVLESWRFSTLPHSNRYQFRYMVSSTLEPLYPAPASWLVCRCLQDEPPGQYSSCSIALTFIQLEIQQIQHI